MDEQGCQATYSLVGHMREVRYECVDGLALDLLLDFRHEGLCLGHLQYPRHGVTVIPGSRGNIDTLTLQPAMLFICHEVLG